MSNSGFWVLMMMISCRDFGEVGLLWNQLQPHNISDGPTWTVNGHRRTERQCLVGNGVVAASVWCFHRWYFSRPLPHHCCCFFAWDLGLSLPFSEFHIVFCKFDCKAYINCICLLGFGSWWLLGLLIILLKWKKKKNQFLICCFSKNGFFFFYLVILFFA